MIRLTTQSDQFAFVFHHADTNNVTETTPGESACGVECIVGRYCVLDIVCLFRK